MWELFTQGLAVGAGIAVPVAVLIVLWFQMAVWYDRQARRR